MTNVKAIMIALGRSRGTAEEVDLIFERSLHYAGFSSVMLIQGRLDWLTWLGACYLSQEDLAPTLRRALTIRFDYD